MARRNGAINLGFVQEHGTVCFYPPSDVSVSTIMHEGWFGAGHKKSHWNLSLGNPAIKEFFDRQ